MKRNRNLLRWVMLLLVATVLGAAAPAPNKPSAMADAQVGDLRSQVAVEPQIPEYHQLRAQRRQEAKDRAALQAEREIADLVNETSPAQRRTVARELSVRRTRLAEVADLVPSGYRQLVLDVADRFAVEPRLLAAVGTVESRWRAWAQGSHGDSGLMQILPSTATWIAGEMGLPHYDLFDPMTNLSMGAWYLKALRSEYGSWDQALAAYNGGPRAVALGAAHPYVGRIMRVYHSQG